MRRGDFQLREEIADQVRALQEMKEMAQSMDDISKWLECKEIVQWLYLDIKRRQDTERIICSYECRTYFYFP